MEIVEPKLLEYKKEIDTLLMLNNIEFESEYFYEPNPEFNSSVQYTCVINNRQAGGLICHTRETDSFGGAVLRMREANHLEKEGFSENEIDREPIWLQAESPKIFIALLAYPTPCSQLKFEQSD